LPHVGPHGVTPIGIEQLIDEVRKCRIIGFKHDCNDLRCLF
jgi:hypothetical protein